MDISEKKKGKTQQIKIDRISKTVGLVNKIRTKWREQTDTQEIQEKINRDRSTREGIQNKNENKKDQTKNETNAGRRRKKQKYLRMDMEQQPQRRSRNKTEMARHNRRNRSQTTTGSVPTRSKNNRRMWKNYRYQPITSQ